jgi:hypothetical protein
MTATEVLGNIQAMTWALGVVGSGDDITVAHLLEAHRRLLASRPSIPSDLGEDFGPYLGAREGN